MQEQPVKQSTPPEDRHSVKPGPPGATYQPRSTEIGNFAEKNFNGLPQLLEDAGIHSDNPISRPALPEGADPRIPPNAKKFRIEGFPGYVKGREPEIDALDWDTHTVIEIKPHNIYEEGLAEARAYMRAT
jgi:hypothetical protein